MNIHVEYTLTPDDFYEYQRAYLKLRPTLSKNAGASVRLWLALAVAVAMLGVIFVYQHFSPSPAPAAPAPPGALDSWFIFFLQVLPYFFIAAFLLFFFWARRSRRTVNRAYHANPHLSDHHSADIDDSGITISVPGCVTIYRWNFFIRFAEAPSLFLFFTQPRMAHMVPKRAFLPADLEMFRRFALAHVGNTPGGFPVLQAPFTPPTAPPPVPPPPAETAVAISTQEPAT